MDQTHRLVKGRSLPQPSIIYKDIHTHKFANTNISSLLVYFYTHTLCTCVCVLVQCTVHNYTALS